MAKKATGYLSNRLHTKVSIGTVEIEFFKTVVLNDVYIEDLHKDTLLYAKTLKVNINQLNLADQIINIKSISLIKATIALVKYHADEDFNYQFIIDSFESKEKKQKKNSPVDFRIEEIRLDNFSFAYKNEHDTLITTGVNYFDLETKAINARLLNFKLDHDTIYAGIDYLSAVEKSGFVLKNLSSSSVKINSIEMNAQDLKITTPFSEIATDLTFNYEQYRDYYDFIDKVKMKAQFNHSKLGLYDIAYFAPELKGINEKLTVTGKVNGKVNDIRGKDMNIGFGEYSTFVGDIALTGLPNIDETVIRLTVKNMITGYSDLKEIPVPPFEKNEKLQLSPEIKKLGKIHFKGTFTGLYNDFYAYGDFNTDLGKLSSDLSLKREDTLKKDEYKGQLKSTAFDFGKFFGIPNLGKVTMNVDIEGRGFSLEEVAANLNGTINALELNSYTYKNIQVKGNAAKRIFNGELSINDENIDFDFSGKVDFTQKLPSMDFSSHLNKANLQALHFVDSTTATNLSTNLNVNVKGNTIDNLIGNISFENTVYTKDFKTYRMKLFDLSAHEQNGTKSMLLNSDFLDASLDGVFNVRDLPVSLQQLFLKYLPSFFDEKIRTKKIPSQNFEYDLAFKNTSDVTSLFVPQLTVAPRTSVHGRFNSTENTFTFSANSPRLTFMGYVFSDWTVNSSAGKDLKFDMLTKRVYISDSVWMNDFNLFSQTYSDSVSLAINWDNQTKKVNKGDIKAFMAVKKANSFEFKILPSEFTINDTTWSVKRSNHALYDSTTIFINDLTLEHESQLISLNGTISEKKDEELKLTFKNFNLSNLNGLLNPTGVKLKGTIDGQSVITDLYHNMVFSSNNEFKSFFVNDNDFGNGSVESVWDQGKEALYMHGSFTLGIVPNVLFSGYYYPKKKEDNLDVELNMQAIQLQIFEPFVKDYCSNLKGFMSGNVIIKGSVNNPKISGLINVNAKKVTVDYLNTSYNFTHEIMIENNSFGVEGMVVHDMNHNQAIVTGKVYHTNFKNFQLDYDIEAKKFLCLNTTEANNSLYYGKAFVTGIVNISGFIKDNILIEANVKTDKISEEKFGIGSTTELTKFFIPLSATGEISENDFITFVKKDQTVKIKDDYRVKTAGLTLDFDLNVTPDAEIQLIFDQKVGDVLRTTGNGNIKLNINTNGEFKMYGDYVVEEGDYLFTLQNIINKRFYLEKGGTIKWSGIPYEADLDLKATYRTRSALYHFFPEIQTQGSTSTIGSSSQRDQLKKRVPIDLKLLMTGDLQHPEINFDIGIPTVDAATRQQVLSYINSDQEMNRQVFSLLILNSFVTPYQLANNTTSDGPNALGAVGSNSTEMLSNQLSNMLSKLSKDVDVGVNYRPGNDISKKELEVVLSTQLFNDKLSVDGNVGSNANSQNSNTNNIVGEVNIEYKLTDDGKVKIKTFNRANDNNQINLTNGPYTQGVGVFYREEFDTFAELFRRYLNIFKKAKKEETPTEIVPEKTVNTDPADTPGN
ncbi:MAG TPA: translocation/assembly module TamB domain-containing protein [Bacteroidia bacterium]|nr:translocation/assembly module TamB domain-containing protein [Bacteroidia bacterium]